MLNQKRTLSEWPGVARRHSVRVGAGPQTDRYLLRREPMLALDDLDKFRRRVNGYYEWHYQWARASGAETR